MDKQDVLELIKSLNPATTKKIELVNKDISELPAEIGNFEQLEFLNLSYNSLRRLPAEIGKLKNLKTLLLLRNDIDKLPQTFSELAELATFDISYNKLVELPPDFDKLINLTSFDVSHNRLKKLPFEFTRLNMLKDVQLDENPFEFPPLKVVKRGLYATMYFLTEEKKKRIASKINIQVYNLPDKIQSIFRQYLDCFNAVISDELLNDFVFDVNFINPDSENYIDFDADTEKRLHEFIFMLSDKISQLKSSQQNKPVLSLKDMEVRDLKKQIENFNETLIQKMKDMQELQSKMLHLTQLLEK